MILRFLLVCVAVGRLCLHEHCYIDTVLCLYSARLVLDDIVRIPSDKIKDYDQWQL